MNEEQNCAVTHFSFIIAGIVQLYNYSPFTFASLHKVSAGYLESNCFQSARLGWNPTESTNMRKKINKEDEEKNLLLTERNPARPKRSLEQSSETEMRHV